MGKNSGNFENAAQTANEKKFRALGKHVSHNWELAQFFWQHLININDAEISANPILKKAKQQIYKSLEENGLHNEYKDLVAKFLKSIRITARPGMPYNTVVPPSTELIRLIKYCPEVENILRATQILLDVEFLREHIGHFIFNDPSCKIDHYSETEYYFLNKFFKRIHGQFTEIGIHEYFSKACSDLFYRGEEYRINNFLQMLYKGKNSNDKLTMIAAHEFSHIRDQYNKLRGTQNILSESGAKEIDVSKTNRVIKIIQFELLFFSAPFHHAELFYDFSKDPKNTKRCRKYTDDIIYALTDGREMSEDIYNEYRSAILKLVRGNKEPIRKLLSEHPGLADALLRYGDLASKWHSVFNSNENPSFILYNEQKQNLNSLSYKIKKLKSKGENLQHLKGVINSRKILLDDIFNQNGCNELPMAFVKHNFETTSKLLDALKKTREEGNVSAETISNLNQLIWLKIYLPGRMKALEKYQEKKWFDDIKGLLRSSNFISVDDIEHLYPKENVDDGQNESLLLFHHTIMIKLNNDIINMIIDREKAYGKQEASVMRDLALSLSSISEQHLSHSMSKQQINTVEFIISVKDKIDEALASKDIRQECRGVLTRIFNGLVNILYQLSKILIIPVFITQYQQDLSFNNALMYRYKGTGARKSLTNINDNLATLLKGNSEQKEAPCPDKIMAPKIK